MHEFAEITAAEVIFVYTPVLAIDAVWEDTYGTDIEYEYRLVPPYLAYLKKKYGAVPHWLLLETVMENSKVREDKAEEMIVFCIRADMFSVRTPEGDRRQRLYDFTNGQKAKLLKARRGEALAYHLAGEQMKQPTNLEAGRTDENKNWYRHALQRVLRQDDRYQSNMQRIGKLKHLLIGFLVIVLTSSWLINLAGATADKGGN